MRVNILHPLTCVNWRGSLPPSGVPGKGVSVQYTYLNQRFYFASADSCHSILNLLHGFSRDGSCVKLDVPTKGFSLTSYRSLLVLVGGMVPGTSDPTNSLWVSADEGATWQNSVLPPMKVNRIAPSVVTTGHPECLFVAGGIGLPMTGSQDNVWDDTTEVLVHGQWVTVQSLPRPIENPKACIHHGNLVVFTVQSDSLKDTGYCCRINSLLATQFQSQDDVEGHSLWKQFRHPRHLCNMLSFGQQFVAVDRDTVIKVRRPDNHKWVEVMHHPQPGLYCMSAGVLPNGELILMAACDRMYAPSEGNFKIYRASLDSTPFCMDRHFHTCAVERLTAVSGIPFHMVVGSCGQLQYLRDRLEHRGVSPSPSLVSRSWLVRLKPRSWKDVFSGLEVLALQDMTEEIKKYLTSVKSLHDLCMEMVSVPLQNLLEPEELRFKLPDYVPPTLKTSIVCYFKAHTVDLVNKLPNAMAEGEDQDLKPKPV